MRFPAYFCVPKEVTTPPATGRQQVAENWRQYWSAHANEFGTAAPAYLRDALLEALEPEMGQRILEAGSGTGGLAAGVASRGASLYLIDIVPKALAGALAGPFKMRGAVADLFAMPFPEATFDAVYNSGVLEHFEPHEITQALVEMRRVTRPGGKVVIAVPSASGRFYVWGKRLMERAGTWEYGVEHPQASLRALSPANLECVSERCVGVRWQTRFLGGWRRRLAGALVAPFSETSGLGARLFGGYLQLSTFRRVP